MRTFFGKEHLYVLSSRFIVEMNNFLHGQEISAISVLSVEVTPVDKLNEKTIVRFKDYNNVDYKLVVSHAKDMCCSNWDLKTKNLALA